MDNAGNFVIVAAGQEDADGHYGLFRIPFDAMSNRAKATAVTPWIWIDS